MDDHIARTTPYTHGYYKALSPLQMTTALELRGLRPPDLGAPLNYCELGMGFGVSLVSNAACFPHIRFHGNDFNPAHVDYARRLAADAGLANIALFDDSFEQLMARELPPMDFIAMHGIYSWVPPRTRRLLVEFIERRLAPGGIVYVSHNVLPGWAALAPLREAMSLRSARLDPGLDTATRVREALAFVAQLQAEGAKSLAAPAVAARLAKLRDAHPAYVAHEFLMPDSHPLYFHQVAAELAQAELAYAGSAMLEDDARERRAGTPPDADPVLHETLSDYRTNALFRRDLYARGAPALDADERIARLDARHWVRLAPLQEGTLTKAARHRLEALPLAPLLAAFDRGSLSLAQARRIPELAHVGDEVLLDAFIRVAEPALPPALAAQAQAGVGRLNEVSLRRAGRDGLKVLLSPRVALATEWAGEALHLVRLHRDGAADAAALAPAWRRQLAEAGQAVRRDGVVLDDPAQQLGHLEGIAQAFLDGQAPKLRELGVL